MNNELMFSSKTDMWATPQAFFDKLHAVFRFETDVCALPDNAKCATYYTPDKNGLAQDWKGTCWMNPPYGREISAWVQKAYRSAKENGATVVCLLPARVDTRWWHDYCANGEVFFVRGRLKFGGAENSAPFPSAVVVFRPTVHDALKVGAGTTATEGHNRRMWRKPLDGEGVSASATQLAKRMRALAEEIAWDEHRQSLTPQPQPQPDLEDLT